MYENKQEGNHMNFIANQEKLGTSKWELYHYQLLYLLTFKKSKWLKRQITQITSDLETIKNRKVF